LYPRPQQGATDQELDNAAEGLEKYVLSKMYRWYFQPVNSDDEFKDQALKERMALMSFVRMEHLDIPASCEDVPRMEEAQTELIKMDGYKAPRDKMICVLNCCKIIAAILHGSTGKSSCRAPLLSALTFRCAPLLYLLPYPSLATCHKLFFSWFDVRACCVYSLGISPHLHLPSLRPACSFHREV